MNLLFKEVIKVADPIDFSTFAKPYDDSLLPFSPGSFEEDVVGSNSLSLQEELSNLINKSCEQFLRSSVAVEKGLFECGPTTQVFFEEFSQAALRILAHGLLDYVQLSSKRLLETL